MGRGGIRARVRARARARARTRAWAQGYIILRRSTYIKGTRDTQFYEIPIFP